MNRRIRFLAALSALVALTLATGEGVWAAVCSPVTGVEATVTTGDAPASDSRAHLHHGSEAPSDDSDRPSSNAPACPLSMAGVGNACGSVSFLPVAVTPVPNDAVSDLVLRPGDDSPGRLLVALHFRPPRV